MRPAKDSLTLCMRGADSQFDKCPSGGSSAAHNMLESIASFADCQSEAAVLPVMAAMPGHNSAEAHHLCFSPQKAIYGNFSGPKAQEVVVSRGKVLELLRPDESGKMQTILSTEIFGQIRSLLPFRLTGGNRDYIVVGSDSGRVVILEYSKEKNTFNKVRPADLSSS